MHKVKTHKQKEVQCNIIGEAECQPVVNYLTSSEYRLVSKDVDSTNACKIDSVLHQGNNGDVSFDQSSLDVSATCHTVEKDSKSINKNNEAPILLCNSCQRIPPSTTLDMSATAPNLSDFNERPSISNCIRFNSQHPQDRIHAKISLDRNGDHIKPAPFIETEKMNSLHLPHDEQIRDESSPCYHPTKEKPTDNYKEYNGGSSSFSQFNANYVNKYENNNGYIITPVETLTCQKCTTDMLPSTIDNSTKSLATSSDSIYDDSSIELKQAHQKSNTSSLEKLVQTFTSPSEDNTRHSPFFVVTNPPSTDDYSDVSSCLHLKPYIKSESETPLCCTPNIGSGMQQIEKIPMTILDHNESIQNAPLTTEPLKSGSMPTLMYPNVRSKHSLKGITSRRKWNSTCKSFRKKKMSRKNRKLSVRTRNSALSSYYRDHASLKKNALGVSLVSLNMFYWYKLINYKLLNMLLL